MFTKKSCIVCLVLAALFGSPVRAVEKTGLILYECSGVLVAKPCHEN